MSGNRNFLPSFLPPSVLPPSFLLLLFFGTYKTHEVWTHELPRFLCSYPWHHIWVNMPFPSFFIKFI